MTHNLPRLTPRIDRWMMATLADHEQLTDLFETVGSPLNLHHLRSFADNFQAYADVIEAHGLTHQILFARKANKTAALAQEASRLGHGVDTASVRELRQCLELGCDPKRLVVTAAIKPQPLVTLALEHDVLLIIDNLDECHLIDGLARSLGVSARVGLRVSGFEVNKRPLYSRFGIPVQEAVPFVVERLGQQFRALQFEGFHFHLNGYDIEERGAALSATIRCADALRQQEIETRFIDIGGGLLVNYLTDEAEWYAFHEALRQAVRGERPPITFGNMGLGLSLIDGEVRGKPNVYPYYSPIAKADFLAELLAYPASSGDTVATLLRERNIELRLEPGRSLLDQVGLTVARVLFRKRDSRGDLLVGLEMNRSQLYSASADFLLDPLLVYQADPRPMLPPADAPEAGYLVGGYCLEQDLILKRKIPLARVPEIGDWVAFPNTAGYMMHFYNTESHLFELAANLVSGMKENGRFIPDAEYVNRQLLPV